MVRFFVFFFSHRTRSTHITIPLKAHATYLKHSRRVDPKELEGRIISHESGASSGGESEGMTKEELQELYEQER